ncbi:hypothetical protein JCM33374_g763 [Metschnikowia sp. JCM 33374]|nr:hypothetical protein JCM33374_g763 [Metschnikowia sp. JCM 33374]
MFITDEFATPSLTFIGRDNLPGLKTGTTSSSTTSTTSTSTDTSTTQTTSSSSETTGKASTTGKGLPGLPGLPTLTSSSSSLDYTTPAIRIPGNVKNPYITRTSQPSGTVFIAVGSVVAVILLVFALFHLCKSFTASSLAKKTVDDEKYAYQKFAHNNNVAYGGQNRASQSALFNNTEYKGSVSKLPLMGNNQLSVGNLASLGHEYSSSVLSEADGPTSHQDLTTMFISPTKEMTSNRAASHTLNASFGNVSMYGRSTTDVAHAPNSNRHSSTVPNYYINESFNNSEYNLAPDASNPRAPGDRKQRNPIPSMYLDDLIDH